MGDTNGCSGGNCATAEWIFMRCRFENFGEAGWRVEDWNALDHSLEYCVFQNCSHGVWMEKGNVYVSYSAFINSVISDFYGENCGFWSIRQCYSHAVGNPYFFLQTQIGCGSMVTIQKNLVVRSASYDQELILCGALGPLTVLDNTFIGSSTSPTWTFNGNYYTRVNFSFD